MITQFLPKRFRLFLSELLSMQNHQAISMEEEPFDNFSAVFFAGEYTQGVLKTKFKHTISKS